VPVEAVIRDGETSVVWVEREPLLFSRRKVKVGLERDGRVQLLEGIKAGEQVVGRGAVFVDNESRT
jgi:cobalt-zinc-cadmium efflux system membrane fusion protein